MKEKQKEVFELLMKFQYGEAEESDQAAEVLFSEQIPEVQPSAKKLSIRRSSRKL